MTPFEKELQQAMQRQEPPADFVARVLARCAEQDKNPRAGFWRMLWFIPTWRLGAATTAAVVLLTGGAVYQQHEQQVKGMAAKRQLLLAMHIAGTKLQEVQHRVKESEQVEQ